MPIKMTQFTHSLNCRQVLTNHNRVISIIMRHRGPEYIRLDRQEGQVAHVDQMFVLVCIVGSAQDEYVIQPIYELIADRFGMSSLPLSKLLKATSFDVQQTHIIGIDFFLSKLI